MDTKSNQQFEKKTLQYYQNKIMNPKNQQMWCKDIKINQYIGDEHIFEDYFRISNKQFRVSKFTVIKKDKYIVGLKFFYQNIDDPTHIIEGFSMGPQDVFENKQQDSKTFELKPNEYIIELFGLQGMAIKEFGVKTNLGHSYQFGPEVNEKDIEDIYNVKAPKGYFLTCFGAYYSPSWVGISSFGVEVKELPQDENEIKHRRNTYQLKSYKPAFRKLIDFLSTSEIVKLFRLNKDFARFRHDNYVLSKIGFRCIYSGSPKSVKYIKKMIKYHPQDKISEAHQQIVNYLNLSCNFISNPDGQKQYDGYSIVKNGGDGFKIEQRDQEFNFITSFEWCTLLWQKDFQNIFSNKKKFEQEDIIRKINNGEYAIIAGAQICDPGFGATAILRLEILNEKNDVIQEIERKCDNLTREFSFYNIKYIHSEKDKIPFSIKFYISGKDTRWWKGHYGAKFKTITVKIIPFENQQEKSLLFNFIK